MKSLTEMNNQELFCVLTGDGEVMQQIMLKNILQAYKEKYPEQVEQMETVDLSAIVKKMTDEGMTGL